MVNCVLNTNVLDPQPAFEICTFAHVTLRKRTGKYIVDAEEFQAKMSTLHEAITPTLQPVWEFGILASNIPEGSVQNCK